MKRSIKILLVTSALVAASGVAVAGRGYNCNGPGAMSYGPGAMGYGPGNAQQMQGQFGPGQGMRGGRDGMSAIYQLDNLTDEQKQQIADLRQGQRAQMLAQREQKWQQRAEMKKQIDAILTDEQREQLSQLRPWR
jgi:Spy/CpxP family protein refolding chaperone